MAEGVRLYSQESWRLITENRGVELVEQFIKNVVSTVDFFLLCSLSLLYSLSHTPLSNSPPLSVSIKIVST